jgi:hypothetical protein
MAMKQKESSIENNSRLGFEVLPILAVTAEACCTCYTWPVRRSALAIVVVLLALSISNVSALVITEPCRSVEQPGRDDGVCPPTCVICGCCAQAAEPVTLHVTSATEIPFTEIQTLVPRFPKTQARDILHVPKLYFA